MGDTGPTKAPLRKAPAKSYRDAYPHSSISTMESLLLSTARELVGETDSDWGESVGMKPNDCPEDPNRSTPGAPS